jgi:4-amino-4-deoxy-L-arabinose transferase-like glycosyltransferase
MKNITDKKIYLIIFFVSIVLFVPFLGHVHLFDWDEINFAESAREMLQTHDFLTVRINYQPFWEKPPLFFWLQAASMKIFGVNEFAARFPDAIAGLITLLLLFSIGKTIYDRKFGIIWTITFAGSFLPFFYFKSGIIDPWFNLFIFLGIYFFFRYSNDNKNQMKYVAFSAISIGLGIMTKGPVALLIFGLAAFIYMIIKKKYKKFLNIKTITLFSLLLIFVGGFWFILQILSGKAYLILDFINYQIRLFSQKDAGHGGFLFYHFFILFFGVFPASVFALKAFKKQKEETLLMQDFRLWMMITFWLVLIIFTIVKTKIVHYSSMCYFPLTFFAAEIIYKIIERKEKFNNWMKYLIVIISSVIGIIVIAITFTDKIKEKIIHTGIIKDPFAIGNLQATANWSYFDMIVGLILILGTIIALKQKNVKKQIFGLFATSMIFMYLGLFIIVPKIEKYSQDAAISFFQSIANQDCYVQTYGYKSYAQYFYTNETQQESTKNISFDILLKGKTDKPVYIICKNYKASEFEKKYPDFKKIGQKNGFVFFKKNKKNK